MNKPVVLLLLFVFIFEFGFSQDVILLKNGEQITGSYKINYKESGDELVSEDGSVIIPSVDIDEYIKDGVATFKSKNVFFYSSSGRKTIPKNALLELGLTGEANLFFYDGPEFDLVLENGELLNVLQELPPNINLENVQNYKITLLTMLGDCLEREEIFNAGLSKNEMISIVNAYNRCSNSDYIPIQEAQKKKILYNLGFGVGIHNAKLDLNVPVFSFNGFSISNNGSIYSENELSKTFAGSFDFSRNLLGSDKLFLESGIGFKKLDFSLESDLRYLTSNKIETTQINLNIGLNYRFFEDNDTSPELDVGMYFWLLGAQETILIGNSSVLPSAARKDYGIGFYFQPALSLDIKENTSLLFRVSYQQRTDSEVFTNNKSAIFSFNDSESDRLYHELTFLIGLRFRLIHEKFLK